MFSSVPEGGQNPALGPDHTHSHSTFLRIHNRTPGSTAETQSHSSWYPSSEAMTRTVDGGCVAGFACLETVSAATTSAAKTTMIPSGTTVRESSTFRTSTREISQHPKSFLGLCSIVAAVNLSDEFRGHPGS